LREGTNIEIVADGRAIAAGDGPYGAEPKVLQAFAPLPEFGGNRAVVGARPPGGALAGLSVRESAGWITTNSSRFLPHAIA
jgi:glutathionylspermidine synthase